MSRIKSIFGDYATELQAIVDMNLDVFKPAQYPQFFDMGIPQVSLNYATIIGESRIEAAASVVAHGSEAPLRTRNNLAKLTGEVPAIKVKRRLQEEQYRNWLTLDSLRTTDETRKQQIIRLIFDDVSYVKTAVDKRIDYMVAQALSKGVISLNATTNPDGIVPGDIDLFVDKKWGTNTAFDTGDDNERWIAGNEATCKPITQLRYMANYVYDTYGITLKHMVMTPAKLAIMMNMTEVKEQLKGAAGIVSGQDALFSMNNLNALLTALDLPTVQLFRDKIQIETNGVLSAASAWADKKYVAFIPEQKVGKIHNAYDIEELNPVGNVDYAVADRVLISKWSETEPFGEYTRGSLAAFPGLEVADTMVIVNTEHRTTF